MTAAIGARYRHPEPRTKYAGGPLPGVLSITRQRYVEQFQERRGPIWDWFAARCPALYQADGCPGERRRSLRSDGADSLLCVIVALLQSMDVRRGFLGRPPVEEGGAWHRRSVHELFGFAFGAPVPRALSIRRIERWLRALRELGMLQTHQDRRETSAGYKSFVAIRMVSDRLFEIANTHRMLAKERREAWERARAERQARAIKSDQRGAPARMTRAEDPLGAAGRHTAGEPRAGPSSAAELLGRITGPLRRS